MTRLNDAITLLESYAGSTIRAGAPSDDALITLLVVMAASDGTLDDEELALLRRLLPLPDDALRDYVRQRARGGIDLDAIAAALDTDDRRWTALRFAARMAQTDDHLDPAERKLLDDLAVALALPEGAVDRALHETGSPDRLHTAILRQQLDRLQWDAAQFADGPVESTDLVPLVPQGATAVCRVGVDSAEVLGIYEEGLVGRFLEGPDFLRWSEIVSANRGQGLESSVRIVAEDGRIRSLVDARLGAVALLIDRLHRPATRPAARAPRIHRSSAPGRTYDDNHE